MAKSSMTKPFYGEALYDETFPRQSMFTIGFKDFRRTFVHAGAWPDPGPPAPTIHWFPIDPGFRQGCGSGRRLGEARFQRSRLPVIK